MAGMNVAELFFTVAGRLNTRVFHDLDRRVQRSNRTINSMGNGLSGMGGRINAILSGLGGTIAINQLIETGKELEVINKKFVIIGGSQEKANDLLKQSRKLAFDLGLPLNEIQSSYGSFLASGIGGSLNQDQMKKTYEDLSFAIAGLGLPTEKAAGSFRAIGQMINKDKIYAEELMTQLGEHMPGALSQTATALGKTTAEIMEMMKQGKLSAKYLPQIMAQMRKMYGKNALANTKGLTGSLVNMNNAFVELQRTFVTSGFAEVVTKIATELTGMLKSEGFSSLVKELGSSLSGIYGTLKSITNEISKLKLLENLGTTTTQIRDNLIIIGSIIAGIALATKGVALWSAAVYELSFIFLLIGEAITGIIASITTVGILAATWGAFLVALPYIIAAAVIAAVVWATVYTITHFEQIKDWWKNFFNDIGNGFKELVAGFIGSFDVFKRMWNQVFGGGDKKITIETTTKDIQNASKVGNGTAGVGGTNNIVVNQTNYNPTSQISAKGTANAVKSGLNSKANKQK